MAKKEIKLIDKSNFSLDNYKASNKLNDGVKDKPLEYIKMSPAFQEVTGLSGVAKGYVSVFRGFSNTGKSTALIEAAVGFQRQGILPVIIDTENNFGFEHAREIGFEFEDVADEETGEIIDYKGFFIYVNNDYLLNEFGKKRNKDLNDATIEDVAAFINKCLEDQANGKLDFELGFLWDSIGSVRSERSLVAKESNPMWDSFAVESSFKSITNSRIPASRKENKKYTNTLVVINKIRLDPMQGAGVVVQVNGSTFVFGARLIFHFGGVLSAAVKKLIAKSNGKEYIYGTQTKVTVEKNHITGSSYKGEIISTAHGFKLPSEMEDYKKNYKNYMLNKLGLSGDSEIEFFETIVKEEQIDG